MISVVGSFVMDLTAQAPYMPVPGETVLGSDFKIGPGGKGGNQATASARLGANVNFVTKLGNDEFGLLAKQNLERDGICLDFTSITADHATGTALIIVDPLGENMIVVTLGACGTITAKEVRAAESHIKKSSVLLVQLETSNEAIVEAVELAYKHEIPVIFNPAPYHDKLPGEILSKVTYITPNEIEACRLSGVQVVDADSAILAANKIKQMGVEAVILTLGKQGCLIYKDESEFELIPSFEVDTVDTTGAGDAFNGGLAYAIEQGMDIRDAAYFANAVAALSVTKFGTAPSMPYKSEVEAFLENR